MLKLVSAVVGTAIFAIATTVMARGPTKVELLDEPCPLATGIRISISLQGTVLVNGTDTDIRAIRAKLKQLVRSDSLVCMYGERDEDLEPHVHLLIVLQAVLDGKYPAEIYFDPEFQKRIHVTN